ncbi:MAG: aminotransferase class V-fold PLP-dependent enzyme [Hyphomicrobiaceae bacterium]
MTTSLAALWTAAAREAITYREGVSELRVGPAATYAEMVTSFGGPLPVAGVPAAAVIEELAHRAKPGLTTSTGPRFFGWVIGASHPVGVAADWLTSTWGQNCANHHGMPAASAAEAVAGQWLLEMLDLPRESSMGFVTGATVANMVSMAAARTALLERQGWDVEADGLFGAPPIDVIVGDDAHTTVFMGLQTLGLGAKRVTRIPTDAQGRMQAGAVEAALRKVQGPCLVVAQAGQLNTGAFDPFADVIPMAHAKGAWVHVDGAFGLWARVVPELKGMTAGIEQADSWATDGHKWLQTPYDCGYAIVRHPAPHRKAMTAAASYLPVEAAGERDPSHYVPELSRRARGFATWAIIKHLGRDGIAAMVAKHCALARRFAARLAAEPGVAVLNDVVLNQAIVRFGDDDAATKEVVAGLQKDGTCYAGGALWRGKWVVRLSVIGGPTTEADIDRSADAIIKVWRSIR